MKFQRTSAKATVLTAVMMLAAATPALAVSTPDNGHQGGESAKNTAKHVLIVSVDGLHQKDLDWYVKNHPNSAMAALVAGGTSYTNAQTTMPSDSFPGMVAQFTGGNPGTTGIYYDDTYNRNVLPAGTTNCAGAKPGAEVALTEAADKNFNVIDAGQGLAGLPGNIMNMTGNPQTVLDPANLPVDPATCKPILPHQYLKVNTVFEVAKQAGMRTAWSDKHPAYEILNGPSGTGLDDLFTPEINSAATGFTGDWSQDNAATKQYDGYKVQAVLNEIAGKDHSGNTTVGEPAIFGMNFQTVSTAQKLPTSDGLSGGYINGGTEPGPLLSSALDSVDSSLAKMRAAITASPDAKNTKIILSAKHGQSPMDSSKLVRVPDSAIIDGLNAAWKSTTGSTADLVAFSTDDDIMQLWLSEHTDKAAQFAKAYLAAHSAAGNDINGAAKQVESSGLSTIYAGSAVNQYFHTAANDSRTPDILGIAATGVVYTGGKSKIAEHGGASADDRNVPLVVSGFTDVHPRTVNKAVDTTQIAPTILNLLGLDPRQLQAVQQEGTKVLPKD